MIEIENVAMIGIGWALGIVTGWGLAYVALLRHTKHAAPARVHTPQRHAKRVEGALVKCCQANQELVEALEGLDEAYCRAGSPLNKQERHEDRMRLIVARRVIAKHKEQA